jgi:hypothetical protein
VVITSTPGTYIHVYNRQKHTCYIKLNRRWQKDTTYVHTIFIFSNLFFKIFFTLKACLELYAATLILESYIYIGLAPCVRVQCFFGQRPLVPLLLLGHPFFSNYSFWVHHLVNQDDRQLLAHAMASDFSVAWQCLSKRTIGFLLRIKLHAPGYNVIIFETGQNSQTLLS